MSNETIIVIDAYLGIGGTDDEAFYAYARATIANCATQVNQYILAFIEMILLKLLLMTALRMLLMIVMMMFSRRRKMVMMIIVMLIVMIRCTPIYDT
jgi:hypothetical protein